MTIAAYSAGRKTTSADMNEILSRIQNANYAGADAALNIGRNNAGATAAMAKFTLGAADIEHGVQITVSGVLAAAKYGLYVYSNAAQINSPLVYFHQDNAGSTAAVFAMTNDGTGDGIDVTQAGVLANAQYGLRVYSNAAQTNSSLVYIYNDNAGSDQGDEFDPWPHLRTSLRTPVCRAAIIFPFWSLGAPRTINPLHNHASAFRQGR